jgi:hypothetical protein
MLNDRVFCTAIPHTLHTNRYVGNALDNRSIATDFMDPDFYKAYDIKDDFRREYFSVPLPPEIYHVGLSIDDGEYTIFVLVMDNMSYITTLIPEIYKGITVIKEVVKPRWRYT